jgi:hypothetical protein
VKNPALNLGPLELSVDPVAARILAERRELFRIAGVNALARSRDGRDLSPEALADVRKWAAFPPLKGPMGTGEPAA